jgi:hypothetical protein
MHRFKNHVGDYIDNHREDFASEVPILARGFGIDKALKSAFAAPGSSRANKQQHNNMAMSQGATPIYSGYANFMQGMQPMMNQAYGNMFNLGTQNNTNALVNQMRQQSLLNGMMSNRAAMNMYGNGALAQGAGINAMNKGMDASNAFMGQQYDPATQMQRMSSGLSAMQTPLQNMQSLAGIVYQQPPVPVGKSGLDYLAQAAGLYTASRTK